MRKTFLILVLMLTLVPATVHAEGFTVLVGAQSVSFGGDVANFYDIPSGIGLNMLATFDAGVLLDVRAGRRTASEGTSGDDITYDWIEFGPRFIIGNKRAEIKPDWFFGVGSYALTIGSLDFDTALGGYLGLGLEETLSDVFVGRIEAKSVLWKSDTSQTDAPSLNIALMFGFKF